MIQKIMNRRFAVVSGLVIMNALGFANVARAGEGGIAGSAAFTVNNDSKVTGVAVSAAVGKDSAIAHAFNYSATQGGVQNSAFAIGSAGATTSKNIGSNSFEVTASADSRLGVAQSNTIGNGYSIQLGTASGDVLNRTPAAATPTP